MFGSSPRKVDACVVMLDQGVPGAGVLPRA